MEFQAFLSWFSRNRLLLDKCEPAASRWHRILSAQRDCAGGSSIDPRCRDALLTAIQEHARACRVARIRDLKATRIEL
jgi:hypothetical protein